MECEVNKDNVNCIWKRYGKIIENDDRIKIEIIGRIQRITINDLNMQDKQTINCCAIKGRKVDEELASTSAKVVIKGNNLLLILYKIQFNQNNNFQF